MHIDLNLLTALNALLEEGSVNGAAERLHLSQPAMSRTLGRIREATGDPILVRSGRGLTPTPYALSVQDQVRALVRQSGTILSPRRALELATLKRTFSLRCHDAVATAIAAVLIHALRFEAPLVRLRILPETSSDTHDLRQGQLDLELGSALPASAELVEEVVYHDQLVVAVRAGHAWCRSPLTAERFARGTFVIVTRRGRLRDPIDAALEVLALRREVAAALPSSTVAMSAVQASNMAVVLPAQMCGPLARRLGLRLLQLPLELRPVPLVMTWHQRQSLDAAHQWFRKTLQACILKLDE